MEGEESSTNVIVEVKNNGNNQEEGFRTLINDDKKRLIDDDVLNGVDEMQKRLKPSIVAEPLDIEAYALQYSGITKIARLLFISDRCDNETMQLEALRKAYDEIKKGKDKNLFRYVVDKINGRLGPDYGSDDAWVNTIDNHASTRKTQLEEELDSSLSRMSMEGMQLGRRNLGDFYYAHGYVDDASYHYERSLEHCTLLKEALNTCMLIILCKVGMGRCKQINRYVNEGLKNQKTLDTITKSKLACASGLSYLDTEQYNYKLAAIKFMEVDSRLQNHYSEVISPQDVAIYGGLCALATFNRTELKNKVLDNLNFKNFLEFVPEMRELINDFYNRLYASCLNNLMNLSEKLKLDIHLHNHVKTLYREIRQNALFQYTLTVLQYTLTVDLYRMAGDLRTSVAELEIELGALIINNKLQARIDGRKKILIAEVLEDGAEMEQVLSSHTENKSSQGSS